MNLIPGIFLVVIIMIFVVPHAFANVPDNNPIINFQMDKQIYYHGERAILSGNTTLNSNDVLDIYLKSSPWTSFSEYPVRPMDDGTFYYTFIPSEHHTNMHGDYQAGVGPSVNSVPINILNYSYSAVSIIPLPDTLQIDKKIDAVNSTTHSMNNKLTGEMYSMNDDYLGFLDLVWIDITSITSKITSLFEVTSAHDIKIADLLLTIALQNKRIIELETDESFTIYCGEPENHYNNIHFTTNKGETLNGTAGPDLIFGGNGADTIYGLGGDDCIFGGNGADKIYGGDGDDEMHGGHGDDFIDGGDGKDIAEGHKGKDTCINSEIVIDCEIFDDDTPQPPPNDPEPDPKPNPQPGNLYCGEEKSFYDNVINGTSGDDVLVGTTYNDLIFGLGGDDLLKGKPGNDCLIGGAGFDTLQGGRGTDTCLEGEDVDDSCEVITP